MNGTLAARWQQAWNEAEPRIQDWACTWSSSGVEPRVLRVNQLDAELLDEELLQVLQEPLAKALGLINGGERSSSVPSCIPSL